uniref:TPM domain-containing protein n=1 Tax=Rhodopseudomonas palustris (strain BisA53) TaxID=316055 RepID=Q07II9_RHOP5
MSVVRASVLALLMCWAFAVSAFAQVAVPPLTGRVVDQTATLTPEATARLSEKLKAFEAKKGSQIVVLLLPTTQPETIEQFSLRVAEAWKIGRKKIDDGAILLIAKNDRKLRIEVGYGLEGALNDVTAKRIIDEIITPKFKTGDFSGGVEDGVDRIIGVIDGEPLPVPKPQHEWQSTDSFDPGDLFNPVLIISALALSGIMHALLGRLLGALATGALVGLIAWLMISSWFAGLIAGFLAFLFALVTDTVNWSGGGGSGRGRSSGGWSSGSSSSSSSSGGFSGGGSFGGGGASGSW